MKASPRKALTLSSIFILILSACGQHASSGALTGAGYGAATSAIGTLAVGLIFGDSNLGERVARSATYGAAVGATVGGIAGAERDAAESKAREQAVKNQAQRNQQPDAELASLRREIGEENYKALTNLALCHYDKAEQQSDQVFQNSTGDIRLYALYIKTLSIQDRGDEKTAKSLYEELARLDPNSSDPKTVRGYALEDLAYFHIERSKIGLSPDCS